MGGLEILGILIMLAIPVSGVVGFFFSLGARRRLNDLTANRRGLEIALEDVARRIDRVERRLIALEAGGAATAAPAAGMAASVAPIAAGEAGADPVMLDERGAVIGRFREMQEAAEDAASALRAARAAAETGPEGPIPTSLGPTEAAAEAAEPSRADAAAAGDTAVPPPPPPAPPSRSLEETLGTRWTVWVGGLALALGAVFMVKYSIEQGFFGPAARIAFAALFSAALLAAGEYLRRNEITRPIGEIPVAHIPGALTAAGTIGAFATVYGAHALYGFIGPATAFLGLGLVGLTTLALALLHGPWLAALGLLGAYATPLLVESKDPNVPALVSYLLIVTASSFGLARLRLWRWVAGGAFGLAAAWFFPILIQIGRPSPDTGWLLAYVAGLYGLTAAILVVSLHGWSRLPEDRPTDRFAVLALSVVAALAFVGTLQDLQGTGSRLLATIVVAGHFALAWGVAAVAPATLAASLLAVISVLAWKVEVNPAFWADTFAYGADGLVALRPRVIADFLTVAGLAGALTGGFGFLGARRATPGADRTAGWFALAGVIGPVMILVVAWLRTSGWESSAAFAGGGLALAAVFAAATALLVRKERPDVPARAVAAYAVGSIAALGAGLAIGLERGALTVALALMVPALAHVHGARPIPALRPLAAIAGLAVLARVFWDPRIVGDDLGTRPILNWLLYGYGIPAAGFAYAAWTFGRTGGRVDGRSGDDVWQRILEALAVIFAGLLVLFQIRHLSHDGDVFAPGSNLGEVGLSATMAFLMSAGLARVAGRLGSRVYDAAGVIFTGAGVAAAALGALVLENPMLTGEPVTHLVFSTLMLGYLLPAAAALLAAKFSEGARPPQLIMSLRTLGVVLVFAWMSLMVRRVYQGPDLWHGPTSDAELWTYSAVWLGFGVALLVGGLLAASQPARLASSLIVTLTVLKVFLYDMSALTGIWRALSFIALGAILIGIGLLYQRLLFRHPAPAPTPVAARPD